MQRPTKAPFRFILLASITISSQSTFAAAQSTNDFVRQFGGIVQSAVIQAAQFEWKKLPDNEIACINQTLQQRGSSVELLTRQGVAPGDPRIAEMRAACRGQITVQPSQTYPQPSKYMIDGLALGGKVLFGSAAYREYRCAPSHQFTSLTLCQRQRTDAEPRGQYTSFFSILHSADGTVFYANRFLQPAFFTGSEATDDIEQRSKRFGEQPRIIPMPQASPVANGVIALWGNVTVEPLDAGSVAELAAGRDPRRGVMIDHIGDYKKSAQLGLPIYRLGGGAGYVWAASYDQNGRGTLRFFAIDASAIATISAPGTRQTNPDRPARVPSTALDQDTATDGESARRIADAESARRRAEQKTLDAEAERQVIEQRVIELERRMADGEATIRAAEKRAIDAEAARLAAEKRATDAERRNAGLAPVTPLGFYALGILVAALCCILVIFWRKMKAVQTDQSPSTHSTRPNLSTSAFLAKLSEHFGIFARRIHEYLSRCAAWLKSTYRRLRDELNAKSAILAEGDGLSKTSTPVEEANQEPTDRPAATRPAGERTSKNHSDMRFVVVTTEALEAAKRITGDDPVEGEAEQLPDGNWKVSVDREELNWINSARMPGETYSDLLLRMEQENFERNNFPERDPSVHEIASRAKHTIGRIIKFVGLYILIEGSLTLTIAAFPPGPLQNALGLIWLVGLIPGVIGILAWCLFQHPFVRWLVLPWIGASAVESWTRPHEH